MRCRMRCGDIWRCGGPIKKHVPVENVSIVGWDSTMSFEAQAQPYYVNYSIDVSPETATNKNVTIVSSNPEVINVSAYDSSTVTFSIEGDGEATITITSQDNPEIKTAYSIEVTPAPTPFAPNNNILVEPTRGEAMLKFFPIDGNDRNYVYADLSSIENLVHITYHGNCDNELCRNLFKSSAFKSRLGRQISEYIDIHGIPESGALEFTSSMWESISDYLEGGDTTVTDIIDELAQGGVIEPAGYCQVQLVSVEENSVTLTVGESTTVGFQIEYDCENPDISNIVIDGGDENVVAVTPSITLGECSVALSGVSEGHTMVTISDGTALLGIRIEVEPVPAPELESITLDSGGLSEITMGENTYFTISYSPNNAEVNLEPFGDYGNAQVRIKNDGKLRVNSTTAGNIAVGVMDLPTGIRSNTLQLSVVPPALQEITFTNDTTDLQIGTTYYFPITTSPRYATATLQAYGMYTDGVDANVSISQNNLVIEPLAVSNIEVGVEDTITGIQSGATEFSLVESLPTIAFDPDRDEDPSTGEMNIDYYPCETGQDCWRTEDEGDVSGNWGYINYTLHNMGGGVVDFVIASVAEGIDSEGFSFYVNTTYDEEHYQLTVLYNGDLCSDFWFEDPETGEWPTWIGQISAIYKESEFDEEGIEIGTVELLPGNLDTCFHSDGPLLLSSEMCGITDDQETQTGGLQYSIYLNGADPLYQEIIDNGADVSSIITVSYDGDAELELSMPQLETLEEPGEFGEYYFPFSIFTETPTQGTLTFSYSDGREQTAEVTITQNRNTWVCQEIENNLSYETLSSMNVGDYIDDAGVVSEEYGFSNLFKIDENLVELNVLYYGHPDESYGYTLYLEEGTYTISPNYANGECPE